MELDEFIREENCVSNYKQKHKNERNEEENMTTYKKSSGMKAYNAGNYK